MFKTRWQTAALVGAGALALTACASTTSYGPAAQNSYGYSEQRSEDDRFRITFRGNSLTDRETVETYLLYRAAELTLANGYDHFLVVEDDTERTTTYSGTATDPFGPRFGLYAPFPYYAYGYPWGPRVADVDLRPRDRYTAIAYVKLGRGEKPADVTNAYDARSVERNLGPRIVRPDPAS